MKNELKSLSDPHKLHSPVSIDGQDTNSLIEMLTSMLLIRKAEQRLALGRKNGLIGGPVHLGAGQEAINDPYPSKNATMDYVYSK